LGADATGYPLPLVTHHISGPVLGVILEPRPAGGIWVWGWVSVAGRRALPRQRGGSVLVGVVGWDAVGYVLLACAPVVAAAGVRESHLGVAALA
jgi:hypothetical protein